MLNAETARALAEYKSWADNLSLEAVARVPEEELNRERPTRFKTIIGTLNHIYVVDLIWQAHLEGRSHGFTARDGVVHTDLAELSAAQRQYNQWLEVWAGSQTDADLLQVVQYQLINGQPGAMTRGAILLHIVNHGSYHRGYLDDLMFQVPAKAPSTDVCLLPGVALSVV
jgi:uncharacterized damage-inducible protein DinB